MSRECFRTWSSADTPDHVTGRIRRRLYSSPRQRDQLSTATSSSLHWWWWRIRGY